MEAAEESVEVFVEGYTLDWRRLPTEIEVLCGSSFQHVLHHLTPFFVLDASGGPPPDHRVWVRQTHSRPGKDPWWLPEASTAVASTSPFAILDPKFPCEIRYQGPVERQADVRTLIISETTADTAQVTQMLKALGMEPLPMLRTFGHLAELSRGVSILCFKSGLGSSSASAGAPPAGRGADYIAAWTAWSNIAMTALSGEARFKFSSIAPPAHLVRLSIVTTRDKLRTAIESVEFWVSKLSGLCVFLPHAELMAATREKPQVVAATTAAAATTATATAAAAAAAATAAAAAGSAAPAAGTS